MFLGVDIGGTTISLGLVRGTEVVYKRTEDSFDVNASLPQTIDYLKKIISDVITPEVTKIGIGVPTIVDQQKGILYDTANIPSWKEVPLKEILEEEFHVPVLVNNDANCFALGTTALAGYPSEVTVAVTLGTGTGIGLVANGNLVSGVNSGCGEIAALPYNGMTYEDFCSKKFFISKGIDPKATAEAAISGDEHAKCVFAEFGRHMAELLKVVMFAYDPGCVILGGGISCTLPLFKEHMMAALRQSFPYSRSIDNLKIMAFSEPDAALIGASLL